MSKSFTQACYRVQNSPSIELRLKRKKNKKVVLFFDSVILKDSLISGKSSRLYGSNQYIPINDVRKIKVHIKDKKEHYFKYISNRIEIGKPLGLVYRKEGKHLSPDKLIDITKANTFAFKEMNMARSYYDASILSGITGGFLIAYALITDINTKKLRNWYWHWVDRFIDSFIHRIFQSFQKSR